MIFPHHTNVAAILTAAQNSLSFNKGQYKSFKSLPVQEDL
jgi:hypothetical protein